MTEKDFSQKEGNAKCRACTCESAETLIESQSSGIPIHFKATKYKVPLDKAKRVLCLPSSITNDTLYNHLVEIIKRVIDERPPNVIDYFEQFSRDVRERKYSTPTHEPQFLVLAKAVLKSTGLRYCDEVETVNEGAYEEEFASPTSVSLSTASTLTKMHRTLSMNENVIQLEHFWGLCGLGFQTDEVFQLSWAIQKIQLHRTVRNARFWGKIFGSNASYFVVEAELTKSEKMLRTDNMEVKLVEEMIAFIKKRDMSAVPQETDPELIPGYAWQNLPGNESNKPEAPPVPTFTVEESFEAPPEPIGTGLNRKTYFVTRRLSDEWRELPIVTPAQIVASRKIRKYFTGALEARLSCYPAFPGTEKNYLRAMIARITAGTYIAPEGYFRKMTQKEILAAEREGEAFIYGEGEGEGDEQDSLESELEDEFEEDVSNNDCPIIENERYEPIHLKELKLPGRWVHCRPHILEQGRVTYVDEEVAISNLAKVALRRMKELEMGVLEEGGDEGGNSLDIGTDLESDAEYNDEENFGEEEIHRSEVETGPELFTSAKRDRNSEDVKPWSSRFSEYCHSANQTIIMRSNLWPGAYTFAHDKCCDSIYLGWGTKFVARCGVMHHLPPIQNIQYPDDAREATDPSVEIEERWRRYHLKKDGIGFPAGEEEMSYSIEIDNDVDDEP